MSMVAATSLQGVASPTRWSHLRLFRALRSGLLVLLCGFLGSVSLSLYREGQAWQAEQQEAGSGLWSAQELRRSLAEMMAAAQAGHDFGPRSTSEYERRHSAVLHDLLSAASGAPGQTADEATLQGMEEELNRFDVAFQRQEEVQARHTAQDTPAHAGVPEALRNSLMASADKVVAERQEALQQVERGERSRSNQDRFLLAVITATLLVCLFSSQFLLSQLTQRTFNAGLLAATLLTVLAGVGSWSTLSEEHQHFTRELVPGMAQVGNVERARAAGALFQADAGSVDTESRARADEEARTVAALPSDLSEEQTIAALREGKEVEGFTGSLADALATTEDSGRGEAGPPGRRALLLEALQSWELLEASEGHDRSLAKATAMAQRSAAAERFEAQTQLVMAREQREIQGKAERAQSQLQRAGGLALAAFAGGVVMVLFGFAPRLREYER